MKNFDRIFKKEDIEQIRKNLIVEQYRRCAEDWRYYDKLLWEIPFTTATVLGAILAIVYGTKVVGNVPSQVKIPLLGCLLIFVVTMFFLSRKSRFLQTARTRFAQCIEKNIAGIEEVPLSTSKSIGFFKKIGDKEGDKKLIRYRAVHFQNLLFISFGFAIIYLLFAEGLWGIITLALVSIGLCIAYLFDYQITFELKE